MSIQKKKIYSTVTTLHPQLMDTQHLSYPNALGNLQLFKDIWNNIRMGGIEICRGIPFQRVGATTKKCSFNADASLDLFLFQWVTFSYFQWNLRPLQNVIFKIMLRYEEFVICSDMSARCKKLFVESGHPNRYKKQVLMNCHNPNKMCYQVMQNLTPFPFEGFTLLRISPSSILT